MIATKSFRCLYDGEEIEIVAGRDIVASGHELVQRFPDNFEPDPAVLASGNGRSKRTDDIAVVDRTADPSRPRASTRMSAEEHLAIRAERMATLRDPNGWREASGAGRTRAPRDTDAAERAEDDRLLERTDPQFQRDQREQRAWASYIDPRAMEIAEDPSSSDARMDAARDAVEWVTAEYGAA